MKEFESKFKILEFTTRCCTKCLAEKQTSEFYKRNDSYTSWCKECIATYQKIKYYGRDSEYRKTDERKKYEIDWHKKHNKLPSGKFYNLKHRAKIANINFNLTRIEFGEWFSKQELICHYCKSPIIFSENISGNGNDMKHLTIDRINNNIGYEIGNIVFACRKCNTIKGGWFTEQEMTEIANKYLIKHE